MAFAESEIATSRSYRLLSIFDKRRLPWIICILGAVFYCYEYYLRIAPSVMTSDLMREYTLNGAGLGNLIAFYYYAYTPMQLFVGILMDRYGPRYLLTIACFCCAVGSYLFATGGNLMLAEIGRFMVGFGSAFAFVGTLKLATLWLPPERFAMVSGFAIALGMVGAVIGDITLMALVHLQGWQATMLLSSIMGLALTVILFLVIRDQPKTLTLASFPSEIRTMNFSQVFYALYRTIRRRQVWLNGLVSGFLYLPASAFAELWGIPFLQARGISHLHCSTAVSMVFIGWAIGGPIAGWISDSLRNRRLPIFFGGLIGTCAIALLIFLPHLSLFEIYILLFCFGAFSSVQVITFAVGREISSYKIAGTAIAFTNMLVMAFGALLQPLIGMLLDMFSSGIQVSGVPVYTVLDYQYALAVIPVGMAIAVIATLFIKETHCELSQ